MTIEKNATAMTATTITSAKYFRFNLFNDTIEGSESNFKKAGNPTSAQYAELMQFKAIQPTFKFAPIASTKKATKKQTYKGLNMELMAFHISQKGNEEAKAEFTHMVEEKVSYPTIKSWFLELYPTIEIAKTQRAMAQKDLADRKATVRKVVKAKMVKAEEPKTSTIALASNF